MYKEDIKNIENKLTALKKEVIKINEWDRSYTIIEIYEHIEQIEKILNNEKD